jgi:hypothetical protein
LSRVVWPGSWAMGPTPNGVECRKRNRARPDRFGHFHPVRRAAPLTLLIFQKPSPHPSFWWADGLVFLSSSR